MLSWQLVANGNQNEYTGSIYMQRAGFVNYPAEWWHFSYGDKMWAAYSHKEYAIYGDVSNRMAIVR